VLSRPARFDGHLLRDARDAQRQVEAAALAGLEQDRLGGFLQSRRLRLDQVPAGHEVDDQVGAGAVGLGLRRHVRATFETVTVASARAAPVLSLTVPDSVARSTCAFAAAAMPKSSTAAAKSRFIVPPSGRAEPHCQPGAAVRRSPRAFHDDAVSRTH
jgi:hypothetical protein